MAELIVGASYPARRSGGIVVAESKSGALMVYIPFALTGGIQFTGNHSVCIGTKDGTLQERSIEGLREIFGWDTENPFDLQRIEVPEGNEPEFILADYHNEPYTPNGKSEPVDSYKFRWLNKLGSGVTPATPDDEAAALAKWGKKFSFVAPKAKSAPAAKVEKPVEKPAEKAAPARKMPTKAPAKPSRVLTPESLMSLLAKKHDVDENDQDAMNKFGNDIYFPATDEVLGNGVNPETPEQCELVAAKFGV